MSLCVCVISNQSTSKNPHVPDINKLDTLLHKTHSNILLLEVIGEVGGVGQNLKNWGGGRQ